MRLRLFAEHPHVGFGIAVGGLVLGALLFHLLSKHCERTSVVIITKLSFSEWA